MAATPEAATLAAPAPAASEEHQLQSQIQQDLQQLQQYSYIRDVMDISNFLNPEEEIVQDGLEDIDQHILAEFLPEEEESDEEEEVLLRVPIDEALEALAKLKLHEEQANKGNQDLISLLNKHERQMFNRRKKNLIVQQDIRSFFGGSWT